MIFLYSTFICLISLINSNIILCFL
jgi:hypothetical protein